MLPGLQPVRISIRTLGGAWVWAFRDVIFGRNQSGLASRFQVVIGLSCAIQGYDGAGG